MVSAGKKGVKEGTSAETPQQEKKIACKSAHCKCSSSFPGMSTLCLLREVPMKEGKEGYEETTSRVGGPSTYIRQMALTTALKEDVQPNKRRERGDAEEGFSRGRSLYERPLARRRRGHCYQRVFDMGGGQNLRGEKRAMTLLKEEEDLR